MSIRKLDLGMPFPTLGDEPWQRDAVNRALDLFGSSRFASPVFNAVRRGPRVIEYFEQAPVLGAIGLAARCIEEMRAGGKLKNILKLAGGSNTLRKFSGKVCNPSLDTVFRRLASINPSTLAQAIPADHQLQRNFLSSCERGFSKAAIARGSALEEWFVGRVAPEPHNQVGSILDYVTRSNRAVDLKWSADEAIAAASRWHDELAKMNSEEMFFAQHKIAFDADVDYGKFPLTGRQDNYEFVALRSGLALFEDGRKMHHCVGSYSHDVITGTSRIYSVREGDKRVATLEIKRQKNRSWFVRQLCGPCNAVPHENIQLAAGAFAKRVIKTAGAAT